MLVEVSHDPWSFLVRMVALWNDDDIKWVYMLLVQLEELSVWRC
jgi:hypothetical protein